MKPKKELKTSITIAASPERVWQVLSDFSRYSEWNSFITAINGEVAEGKTIEALINGMTIRPKILAFKPNEELRWKGKLFVKGLFDGEHSFTLVDNQDGTTTFLHNEKFNGIFVGLLRKTLDTTILDGFRKMNEELKKEAETRA